MITIFSDYGIEIENRDGVYFIIYDGGGIVSEDYEIEISIEDVTKAQLGPEQARQVLLKNEARRSKVTRG